MQKITKYRYDIYLFVIEAICMVMELCASRVLSPFFGDSNIIWTSIIGIILLSSSIGNTIGGRLADKDDVQKDLCKISLWAAVLILYIPVLSEIILGLLASVISNIKIGAIIGTVLLFLPSSIAFGMIPPIITKIKLKDLETAGKTSGTIHAVSTLGSITGTFLGGFFLVPNFGCDNIMLCLTCVTALMVILVGGKNRLKYVGLIFAIAIACIYVLTKFNLSNAEAILEGEEEYIASYDTQYSKVEVVNRRVEGENIRYMLIGNGCESATYVDEDKKYELVVPYTKYYDLMYEANIDIRDALMIGGGGYSYPKYCVSHHLETVMDVVEIDEQITELAKEYFYLDDALRDFNDKLNIINEDGKVFINTTDKKYDAVLNDAFTGTTPAESLTTLETVEMIHGILNPGGVYLSNIIGSRTGENSKFLAAEVNTISQVFDYVYIVPCGDMNNEEITDTTNTNNMVIATDTPLDIPEAVNMDYEDSIILTDDYCPVDTLIPAAQ